MEKSRLVLLQPRMYWRTKAHMLVLRLFLLGVLAVTGVGAFYLRSQNGGYGFVILCVPFVVLFLLHMILTATYISQANLRQSSNLLLVGVAILFYAGFFLLQTDGDENGSMATLHVLIGENARLADRLDAFCAPFGLGLLATYYLMFTRLLKSWQL